LRICIRPLHGAFVLLAIMDLVLHDISSPKRLARDEQPNYFQLVFALDRVKALAPQHPEWKDKEPFAVDFIERVTKQGSSDFVPAAERIATLPVIW
jgi:hypothetical protein